MKRFVRRITWDQLKRRRSSSLVARSRVLGVAVYKLGQAANLFAKRYELVAYLPDANGLRVGRPGDGGRPARGHGEEDRVPAGRHRHDAQPASSRSTIDEALREQIRRDSRGAAAHAGPARRQGVRHHPGHAALRRAAATATRVAVGAVARLRAVIAQASGAVDDMVGAHARPARDHRRHRAGRGHDRAAASPTARCTTSSTGTLAATNQMLARLQNPNGTRRPPARRPALYDEADRR